MLPRPFHAFQPFQHAPPCSLHRDAFCALAPSNSVHPNIATHRNTATLTFIPVRIIVVVVEFVGRWVNQVVSQSVMSWLDSWVRCVACADTSVRVTEFLSLHDISSLYSDLSPHHYARYPPERQSRTNNVPRRSFQLAYRSSRALRTIRRIELRHKSSRFRFRSSQRPLQCNRIARGSEAHFRELSV